MAQDVLLHVGLMKSGTTFVQGRLGANLDVLERQGILFPTPWRRQVRAVTDLAGNPDNGPGAYDDLVTEIRAHEGRALVSMEFLGPLGRPKIERLRDELGGRVRMVATVRDLGRTVPAMWQESMQNRGTLTYAEYLAAVKSGEGEGKIFWRQQGAGRIIDNWVSVLGAENVTVVTVPPPGAPSEQLWERFCQVAGIEAADWADAPRSNESLGAASALVMGRLNEAVAGLDRNQYNRRVKNKLSKQVLAARKREEDSIGFAVPDWLKRRSKRRSARIADSGARIVGDLAELAPVDVRGVDPDKLDVEDQFEAALAALAALMKN